MVEIFFRKSELDDDEDAKVIMKDDDTYSPSDEGGETARHVDQEFGICKQYGICTVDERKR